MLIALLWWMQIVRGEGVRLVVIVSSSQRITDISSADLRAIYLGHLTRWPAHQPIVPVMMPPGTAAGRAFIRHLIGMADLDYEQHWIGMVFRGQAASLPLIATSTEEATRFVRTHSDAIAILAEIPTETNVRVLTVDGKSRDAPDYALHW